MVIDSYVHPLCYGPLYDEETFEYWEREYGMGLMGPMEYDEIFAEMDWGGVDMNFLMPLDVTTISGGYFATNDDTARLAAEHPERFVNFASVDPSREDAADELERAFTELGAKGLHLHPGKQRVMATDRKLEPLFELCERYDRPVYFDAGLSWEPSCPMRYTHPLAIEEAIMDHPNIRFALAHFAWPWVREMVALMLKYPNVYTDCSVLYLDSPEESIERLFTHDMGPMWFERSFAGQVMLASNTPRFRCFKIKRSVERLGLPEDALEAILGGNALAFLGEKGAAEVLAAAGKGE